MKGPGRCTNYTNRTRLEKDKVRGTNHNSGQALDSAEGSVLTLWNQDPSNRAGKEVKGRDDSVLDPWHCEAFHSPWRIPGTCTPEQPIGDMTTVKERGLKLRHSHTSHVFEIKKIRTIFTVTLL